MRKSIKGVQHEESGEITALEKSWLLVTEGLGQKGETEDAV